jgi:hypothetical protein
MTRRCCPQAVVIPLASTSTQPSESIVTVIIVGIDSRLHLTRRQTRQVGSENDQCAVLNTS